MAHRLRPNVQFPCALAHRYAIGGMHNHPSAKRQLLRRRTGSYQFFQQLALLGQDSHRIGGP